MPKRHSNKLNGKNGSKMHTLNTDGPKKNGTKITWYNASDQIQAALACLEKDTETGLKTLKTKIEAMGQEAREVGAAAKATTKREP